MSATADALTRFGGALPPDVEPLEPWMRAEGSPEDACGAGSGREFGYWGELMTAAAVRRDLHGLVIDGGGGMRLALVQLQPGDDLDGNVELAVERLRAAAANGAEVVCFPEIQLSPFFPQFPDRDASRWAVTLEDEAIAVLCRTCRELGVVAFPNVYLLEGELAFDASLAIGSDGTLLGVSKMVHVVRMPRFYEQDYYTPSDTGFRVYDTRFGRIGVVICFDRHYPESIRTCVLRGAQIVVIPTVNTRDEDLELFEWEVRVAAAQNGVYLAMCNRVGDEDAMAFAGESIVAGPTGGVIAKADDTEQILYADLVLDRIEEARALRPYLSLRRPETYETESPGP